MKCSFLIVLLCLSHWLNASPRETKFKLIDNVALAYDGEESGESMARLDFLHRRVAALAERYNYHDLIIINHLFSKIENPVKYFMCYCEPIYEIGRNDRTDINRLAILTNLQNKLIITIYDEEPKQIFALKLLDYALSNLEKVKKAKTQLYRYQRFEYEFNNINSVDTSLINKIMYAKEVSTNVSEIYAEPLEREENESTFFISYFTKNDKFFPYHRKRDVTQILDTLNHVHKYIRLNNSMFIFETPSKFNYYSQTDGMSLATGSKYNTIVKRNQQIPGNVFFDFTNPVIEQLFDGVYLIQLRNLYFNEEVLVYSVEHGFVVEGLKKYRSSY